MEAFDAETAQWAWDQVISLMRRHKVQRRHVTAATDISERNYDDLRKGNFAAGETRKWLDQLWTLLQRINRLIECPPPRSRIQRGAAATWNQLFSERPDFPSSPGGRGDAPMDAGSAELGVRWKAESFLPYEEQLKRERARFEANDDASKRRQVIEKLATLYEATGKWQHAVARLQELREINLAFRDDYFVADCDLRLGIAFYRLGRWQQAALALCSGLNVVEQRRSILGKSKTELRLRGYLGLVQLRCARPREALRIFEEDVSPLVRLHNSTYVTATFHHRRALIHEALGDFRRAHEDIGLALEHRIQCGAQFEVTRTLFYLGRICERQGYRRAAVAIWKLCEDRHMRLEDPVGLARAKLELGRVYADWAEKWRNWSDLIQCDVFEADLDQRVVEALQALATSYRLDPSDGLHIDFAPEDLEALGKEALEGAIHYAQEAGQPALRNSATATLERLLYRIPKKLGTRRRGEK